MPIQRLVCQFSVEVPSPCEFHGSAHVFASRGVNQMHTITIDEREHLSVLTCMNFAGERQYTSLGSGRH